MNSFDNNFFWKQEKTNLFSKKQEIHFYFVSLIQTKTTYEKLYSVLSEDEKNFTKEYLLEKPKTNFVISQGVLRFLLGFYLNIKPEYLQIKKNKNGKPFVILQNGNEIFFNKSHSGDYAFYGITYSNSIGVDIEKIRVIDNLDLVSEKVLTKKELYFGRKITEEKRNEYFLKYWSCKESFIKAIGYGLYKDPKSIELYLSPHTNHVRILSIDNQKPQQGEKIKLLDPLKDYTVAFCSLGNVDSIRYNFLDLEEFLELYQD